VVDTEDQKDRKVAKEIRTTLEMTTTMVEEVHILHKLWLVISVTISLDAQFLTLHFNYTSTY